MFKCISWGTSIPSLVSEGYSPVAQESNDGYENGTTLWQTWIKWSGWPDKNPFRPPKFEVIKSLVVPYVSHIKHNI